jgi:hypothetical protein
MASEPESFLLVWRSSKRNLALNRAGRHPFNDLPLEEEEHDQRRDRDDNHIGEEQVPL